MAEQRSLFSAEPSAKVRKPAAYFSACTTHGTDCTSESCIGRLYRFTLYWPTGVDNDRVALFVLANPSTASAEESDPTVTRCINYAKLWGFGWCSIVNVRAWRATDPKAVPEDPRAIGEPNDQHILSALKFAEVVVCGWGKLGGTRAKRVLELIDFAGSKALALKLNKDGSPAHPLYLASALKPFPIPEDYRG